MPCGAGTTALDALDAPDAPDAIAAAKPDEFFPAFFPSPVCAIQLGLPDAADAGSADATGATGETGTSIAAPGATSFVETAVDVVPGFVLSFAELRRLAAFAPAPAAGPCDVVTGTGFR